MLCINNFVKNNFVFGTALKNNYTRWIFTVLCLSQTLSSVCYT